MRPRKCPACQGLFIMGGAARSQVDLNPDAPIEIYGGKRTGCPIGQCPHCETALTSDAFPAAGMLIPYNIPMLENEAQDVPELIAPMTLPTRIATKMSQDDVEGWMRDTNRRAAEDARTLGWLRSMWAWVKRKEAS